MSLAQSSLALFWVGLGGLIFLLSPSTTSGRKRSGPEPLLIYLRNLKGGYLSHTSDLPVLCHSAPGSLPPPLPPLPPRLDEPFFLRMGRGLEVHPEFMRTQSNRSLCGDVPINLSYGKLSTGLGREFHNAQCQLRRLSRTGKHHRNHIMFWNFSPDYSNLYPSLTWDECKEWSLNDPVVFKLQYSVWLGVPQWQKITSGDLSLLDLFME